VGSSHVGVTLLIYDPPAPGAPFLTVAAQNEAAQNEAAFEILFVGTHPTRAAAERALANLAAEFDRIRRDEPS